jgi:alanyl-tRNA synthetase
MTRRLYYTDPYKRTFDATIVGIDRRDGKVLARLDETAFYPTSGGQPFDTGVLTRVEGAVEAPVVDAFEDEAGEIVHVLETPSASTLEPGDAISGSIEWQRRFDHMQQHTGQHLLSAAFDRLFSIRTLSFHLGADLCTIDLSREASAAEITAAEAEANRIVWENREVTIRFVTADAAAALPLRKEPSRDGMLRLVEIGEFDLSACGGTHVSHTGAVGVIAATGWERFKGGQRLEFVCGGRALRRFRVLRDDVSASARRLSVLPGEVAVAVERLQSEAKELRRTGAALQADVVRYRAAELAASTETFRCGAAVLQVVEGDAAVLKGLVAGIIAQPRRIAVLASRNTPVSIAVGVSPDADCAANELLASILARFGGRGGGKRDLAQGGGLTGSAQDVICVARELLAGTS